MKRPLVVLAAGYVLGEVLALQVKTAVDLGVLAWLCAAAAGILWLFGYREGSTAPFCSKREDAGQKQPETQGASALFGMSPVWFVFGNGKRMAGKGNSGP